MRSEDNEAGWLTPVKEADAAACKDVLLLFVFLVRENYYMIYKAPPQKNLRRGHLIAVSQLSRHRRTDIWYQILRSRSSHSKR